LLGIFHDGGDDDDDDAAAADDDGKNNNRYNKIATKINLPANIVPTYMPKKKKERKKMWLQKQLLFQLLSSCIGISLNNFRFCLLSP
jgi:hypothetical protein